MSTGDDRSYDSAETRFGVQMPEKYVFPDKANQNRLARDEAYLSQGSGHLVRDETYGSTDVGSNKFAGTSSYGERDEDGQGIAATR